MITPFTSLSIFLCGSTTPWRHSFLVTTWRGLGTLLYQSQLAPLPSLASDILVSHALNIDHDAHLNQPLQLQALDPRGLFFNANSSSDIDHRDPDSLRSQS